MRKQEEGTENIFKHINPIQAIDYAIKGIERFRNKEGFKFDMETFGTYGRYLGGDDNICYGCLATACIFTIVDEEPNEDNIDYVYHPVNGYTRDSVSDFEDAMDSLRQGMIISFLEQFVCKSIRVFDEKYGSSAQCKVRETLDWDKDLEPLRYYDTIFIYGEPTDEELDEFVEELKAFQKELKNFTYLWESDKYLKDAMKEKEEV